MYALKYTFSILSILGLVLPWIVIGGTYSLETNRSSSEYAYAADSATLSPTGSMTVMGWVKFDARVDGNAYVLADKFNGGDGDRGWQFNAIWTTTATGFNGTVCENSSCGAGDNVGVTGSWTPVTGTWYHIAYTFTNSGSGSGLKVLLNGARINGATTTGFTGVQNENNNRFTIGSYYDGGTGNYFDGNIAEVQYWGTDLKDSEVITYACTPPVGGESNLLAYWSLDNSDASIPAGSTLTRSGAVYEALAVDKSGISSCPSASTNNPGGLRGNVNIKGGGNFYWLGN
jgi:hypothetical protein